MTVTLRRARLHLAALLLRASAAVSRAATAAAVRIAPDDVGRDVPAAWPAPLPYADPRPN